MTLRTNDALFRSTTRLQRVAERGTDRIADSLSVEDALLVTEYGSLRDEIVQRLNFANRLATFPLLSLMGLLTFARPLDLSIRALLIGGSSHTDGLSQAIFYLYPLFVLVIAAEWIYNNTRIAELGGYLLRIEGKADRHLGWERFAHTRTLQFQRSELRNPQRLVERMLCSNRQGLALHLWGQLPPSFRDYLNSSEYRHHMATHSWPPAWVCVEIAEGLNRLMEDENCLCEETHVLPLPDQVTGGDYRKAQRLNLEARNLLWELSVVQGMQACCHDERRWCGIINMRVPKWEEIVRIKRRLVEIAVSDIMTRKYDPHWWLGRIVRRRVFGLCAALGIFAGSQLMALIVASYVSGLFRVRFPWHLLTNLPSFVHYGYPWNAALLDAIVILGTLYLVWYFETIRRSGVR